MVDLPSPDSPVRTTFSPGAIHKEKFSKMVFPWNRTRISFIVIVETAIYIVSPFFKKKAGVLIEVVQILWFM
jgi:hypothetical protein